MVKDFFCHPEILSHNHIHNCRRKQCKQQRYIFVCSYLFIYGKIFTYAKHLTGLRNQSHLPFLDNYQAIILVTLSLYVTWCVTTEPASSFSPHDIMHSVFIDALHVLCSLLVAFHRSNINECICCFHIASRDTQNFLGFQYIFKIVHCLDTFVFHKLLPKFFGPLFVS